MLFNDWGLVNGKGGGASVCKNNDIYFEIIFYFKSLFNNSIKTK